MPRGTCENCGRHDAFLYATPFAFGKNIFVCSRCLNIQHERDEDEDDDGDERDEDEDADGPDQFAGPAVLLADWS